MLKTIFDLTYLHIKGTEIAFVFCGLLVH